MSFNKIILLIVLFLTVFTVNSFSFNKHSSDKVSAEINKLCYLNSPEDEGYVLVFIDGKWWWVLYGPDGLIVDKIPYDF